MCQACAEAKARQKSINKTTNIEERKDWNPGEKLWMDVSSIKHTSYGGAKFWFLIVDDKTDYCWSYFLKKKNELSQKLENLVMKLKSFGIEIKKIRCDNAGENIVAERKMQEKGRNIKFEFTAPNTPQQNGKVERKFSTLYGTVRATLNDANLKGEMRNRLWAECANHCMNQENIGAIERKGCDIPWIKEEQLMTNVKHM